MYHKYMQMIDERKWHNIILNMDSSEDLKLAMIFLDMVQHDASMNLLTFRKADIVYILCDASEYGWGDLHPMVGLGLIYFPQISRTELISISFNTVLRL